MSPSEVILLAFLIGVVSGLRSLTAPAAVAWAAHLGWIKLGGRLLAFMGSTAAVAIFTLAALGELVADKLPSTPSRTAHPGTDRPNRSGRLMRGKSVRRGDAIRSVRRGHRSCRWPRRNICRLQSSHWSCACAEGSGHRNCVTGRRGGHRRNLFVVSRF